MMGPRQEAQPALFYEFSLKDHVPQARGASDTTIDYLDTQVRLVEDILAPYQQNGQIETVQNIIGVGGSTSAFIVVRLPDWGERDFTQQ